jgi:predicted Zn finger-like uncharacterized protein
MVAACPHCGARYRIERQRLPAQGARLRCSRCEAIFRVSPPAPASAAAEPARTAAASETRSEAQPSGVPDGRLLAGREPAASPQTPAAPSAGPRRLVLVADPDVEAGTALAGALAGWDIEPVLVHDGVEAVLTIQRRLPSLVVLEASLPKMFGFQVCELMKRNEQLRAIPVVLVGAIHQSDRYRREAAETYGADAYVERPELPQALLAILQRLGLVAPPEPTRPPAPRSTASEARSRAQPSGVPDGRLLAGRPPARDGEARSRAKPSGVPDGRLLAGLPAAGVAAAGPGGDPALAADIARAERLARIIVSDIVLYNPERFEAGLRCGDVLGAMAAEMEEGRAHFRARISERVREQKDFLGEELVRVARLRGMK